MTEEITEAIRTEELVRMIYTLNGLEDPASYAAKVQKALLVMFKDPDEIRDLIECKRRQGKTTLAAAKAIAHASQGKTVNIKTLQISGGTISIRETLFKFCKSADILKKIEFNGIEEEDNKYDITIDDSL